MEKTAVEWLIDRIEDVDLTAEMFERIKQQAKEMEKKQHGETWDSALKAGEDRAWNVMRAYGDFDDYWDKLNKQD
jgi:hypothetical protein